MLGAIRKFSSSIYAKIFLFFVAIPFIFWGMGPVFTGGNLNTIVKIENKKISTQKFVNFMKFRIPNNEIIDNNLIENLLHNFIGEKLIDFETENLDIRLSDNSLSKIIKNEEIFKKDNRFSRIEYEKFLVKNSLNAVTLEANISKQEKNEQLFNFIGGGIVPSKFLVDTTYDNINQKRNIQLINLNEVFKNRLNFSENKIQSYFDQNKDAFKDVYKSVKFIKLNPQNLSGSDEFNDLFFQKTDEIDDLITEGKNLDYILKKFNLGSAISSNFQKLDIKKNSKKINGFPTKLIKNIFRIDELEPTVLMEHEDSFFVVELTNTGNIQRKITDKSVKKEILLSLENQTKRKLISEIISEINKNNFNKSSFDKLANNENVAIKKITLANQNDYNVLKQDIVKQVYTFPERKTIVVNDINLSKNFLIYIDKIENVSIAQNSEDFEKYFLLSKTSITNSLYNTYDSYLKNKYKISINYKALDNVKNNFR